MTATLVQLFWLFLGLSLLAVGSGNSVIPAIQHAAVTLHHWMSGRDFLELFAISRLAPGPGSLLVVVLVGQKAAGLPGAAVAALAMFGPSCLLVYGVSRLWHRYRERPWRELAERGLAPVAVGMVFASAIALIRGTEHEVAAYAITALVAAVLATTRLNPLWLMAAAAAAGWLLRL
jgi:chromate transporter